MKTFVRMVKDESGASAAEYALILAIIGSAIAIAAVTLGGAISDSMNRATTCIQTSTDATPNCG
jgi:pilus assembly protein Flp/PilA